MRRSHRGSYNRKEFPAMKAATAVVHNFPVTNASPSPALHAGALQERMAQKRTMLQRRHLLADVIHQYVMAGKVPDNDGGRRATLRMWQGMLGESHLDEITPDHVQTALELYAESPVIQAMG